jgi:hypothetical protein
MVYLQIYELCFGEAYFESCDMFKKIKCSLAKDVAEFYLLLSSSQELSFKCWEKLVIIPAHC